MEIADVYLKNSSTGVSAVRTFDFLLCWIYIYIYVVWYYFFAHFQERDSNSPAISPVLIVVDHIGTTIPADSTSPHKGQNSYTDANESTQQDVPRHATAGNNGINTFCPETFIIPLQINSCSYSFETA